MPSIVVPKETQAITAATNKGLVTVASTTNLYPGTNAWMGKNDGSANARVKILKILTATTFLVRKWPTRKATDATEPSHDLEDYGPPSYGLSDVSAFNATSHITMETQSVPIDPAFTKRTVS